jgi:hypothetical protein
MCSYHRARERARRQTRHSPAASTTKPAATMLQAEEV